MANEEQLAVLKKGVKEWNEWRILNNPVVDLSSADLSGLDLGSVNVFTHADLHNSILTDTDMTKTDLGGASLVNADLTGANLRGASLAGAELWGACLDGASLVDTVLYDTDFSETHADGTDFSNSVMDGTIFAEVDLSCARGLDEVRHEGPCKIGIGTIYLSGGKIPDAFLRGAGVPEDFITYMKSLVGKAIEFYSCFISYSTKDQEFAERLHGDLQNKNVRCWFAPHDVQGGKKLHEQIDEAIRVHEKVLLILSAESMNSEWVKTEIAKARKREVREKRQVLFPVRLVPFEAIRDWECFDADTGKDSAREIREYFIPDFSNWKNHDEYQKAFERLMKDLKAGGDAGKG